MDRGLRGDPDAQGRAAAVRVLSARRATALGAFPLPSSAEADGVAANDDAGRRRRPLP
jgi:hypothetical protein